MGFSEKKKKILFIPEFNEFGGALTYATELLIYYIKRKYEIVICFPSEYKQYEIMKVIKDNRILYYHIPKRIKGFKNFWRYLPFNFILDFYLIYRIYKKEKPDLFVVSNIFPESYLGLALLRTPFISIQHTYHLIFNPLNNRIKLISKLYSSLNKYIFALLFNKHPKILIVVSEYTKKKYIQSCGITNKNLFVIYNFGVTALTSHITNCTSNKILILTLGHVRFYKNPLIWIKVAEEVLKQSYEKDIEFLWGGDGELLEECKSIVKDKKLDKKIKFIGYVKDVSTLYKTVSIYFQPSLIESHGIAVVEAMAYSLPCVVSNIGGLPESVENDVNGYLIDPNSIIEMSSVLITLINNDKQREEMGKHSLEIYNSKFSYEVWQQKMDNIHKLLL